VRRPIEVELLAPGASDDGPLMKRIATLANEVYAVAEAGLWKRGTTRTTVDEVAELTRASEIAIARLSGAVVGCVHLQRLDPHTGRFGMLAADPDHRGAGVGRELVRFAEDTCRAEGLRTMRLELLVPRAWTHPSKEFLAAWYTRMGYRVAHTGTLDDDYPHLAPLLATPCDLVIYDKDLTTPPSAPR
jgi:GNAT superfamily N-acetyltransferase